MMKRMLSYISLALLLAVQTSCRENKFGVVDLDIPDEEEIYTPIAAQYTYSHPCAMFNQKDFDRVKKSLDEGTAPQAVKDELTALKNSRFTVPGYTPTVLEYIVRGDGNGITSDNKEHYAEAMYDAAAAYQCALLWKLTGEEQYAKIAVNVMNAWAAGCKGIRSNDANKVLAAGAQGYTFACAGEMMRTYSGWNSTDFAKYKEWMMNVFASENLTFLSKHQNGCSDHYWSNWDLVNLCSYLGIGILCENDEMVNYVVNYFYAGVGNGCIKQLIRGTFDDPYGSGEQIAQNQESGRDQGHAMMSVAVSATLAQMAYTLMQSNPDIQQLDFFAANDNALMKMGEYVALFNLRDGGDQLNANGAWIANATKMPFNEYRYCMDCAHAGSSHSAVHTAIADDSGRGNLRPGWEIYYNHYAKVKGLSSGFKYAKMAADKMRPECGADGNSRYGTNSGAFDQLGWNTLMMYQE